MFKAKQQPVFLASGIDRLVVTISPIQRVSLRARDLLREKGIRQIEGHSCVVVGRSVDPLQNDYELADFVLIDSNRFEEQVGGPIYHLCAGARTCATMTPRELLEGAAHCIEDILGDYQPRSAISYLELYVDMQNSLRPSKELRESIRTRTRKFSATSEIGVATATDPDQMLVHIGSRDKRNDSVRAVYYEKPLLDPKDWRLAFWALNKDFNSKDTVRRLEFRVPSRRTLEKLAINPSPTAMLNGGLNTLWGLLTSRWMRVVRSGPKEKKPLNHSAWDKITAMKPIPDGGDSPRDFVVPESSKKLERQVAMGAAFIRTVADLPDSEEHKRLAYMAFLDAVTMLRNKQLPFECEDVWAALDSAPVNTAKED